MNNTGNLIKATLTYHEGYSYVEFNGEFFKGCKRCGGTGHYMFDGFDSLCYLCRNTDAKLGEAFANEDEAKKWCHGKAVRKAQADRKRETVRLAKIAKRQAAWDALAAQHPGIWELLSPALEETTTERDSFVLTMAAKLYQMDEVGFSPRQLEVLNQIVSKRVARQEEAATHPAPTGRIVVTGEIVSTKIVEGDYGTAYKILVKDDAGHKVWCSLPKAQADEAIDEWEAKVLASNYQLHQYGYGVWFGGSEDTEYTGIKGRRITFTATLEPSKDDVAFAFGSRPTKGAWL